MLRVLCCAVLCGKRWGQECRTDHLYVASGETAAQSPSVKLPGTNRGDAKLPVQGQKEVARMFTSPIGEGVDGVFVMCLQKSIPLETPTWVELGPQAKVRVTLFDVSGSLQRAGSANFLSSAP